MTGSRILNLLLASAMKAAADTPDTGPSEGTKPSTIEEAQEMVAAIWLTVGVNIPEDTYAWIQRMCLRAANLYLTEQTPPVPVLSKNGRWADKELEFDSPTVNRLITEVLQFNLSRFFFKDALSESPDSQLAGSQLKAS